VSAKPAPRSPGFPYYILPDALPPRLAERLAAHCKAAADEDPSDVIADALSFHLDALEQQAWADEMDALLGLRAPAAGARP
jgi:hypothetical protein